MQQLTVVLVCIHAVKLSQVKLDCECVTYFSLIRCGYTQIAFVFNIQPETQAALTLSCAVKLARRLLKHALLLGR